MKSEYIMRVNKKEVSPLQISMRVVDALKNSVKRVHWTVLRIRDVYPGSRILIFTHPGSRIPDLGSRIQKQQQKREVKKN